MIMDLVRRTIERYVRLTEDGWSRVGPCWREHAFSKGALISKVGEVEQRFYIVKSGVQRISFPHDGEDICVGFSYDGSWCGAFDSFVSRKPGRFDVRAVTDSGPTTENQEKPEVIKNIFQFFKANIAATHYQSRIFIGKSLFLFQKSSRTSSTCLALSIRSGMKRSMWSPART